MHKENVDKTKHDGNVCLAKKVCCIIFLYNV